MEQKDYIMREIEKIGLMLRSILGSLINKKDNLSIETPTSFELTKELLMNEINFDLAKFMSLDESAANGYLLRFKGFHSDNLEVLAEILFQFGNSDPSDIKRLYFEKAVQLYELSSNIDKTFSSTRESRISEIKMIYDRL